MAWQRYNPTTHVFEQSVNNGASWTVMPLDSSCLISGGGGANIAYTNLTNNFTLHQHIKTVSGPQLRMIPSETGRAWQFYADGNFYIMSIDDLGNWSSNYTYWSRAGDMNMPWTSILVGKDIQAAHCIRSQGDRGAPTGAAGPGIEIFFQGGVGYLHCYDVNAGTYPEIYITGGTVNISRSSLTVAGNIHNTGGYIYPGRADAGGSLNTSWWLGTHASYGLYSNTGLNLGGGLWVTAHADIGTSCRARAWFYELNRATALGHWIAFNSTFWSNTGATVTSGAAYGQYCLIGNTCIYNFEPVAIDIAGAAPTEIYMTLPVQCIGRYATWTSTNEFNYWDGVTYHQAWAGAVHGNSYANLQRGFDGAGGIRSFRTGAGAVQQFRGTLIYSIG